MSENPSVRVNGQTRVVADNSDVLEVFEAHAGFGEGDQVEELTIRRIDAELDYNIVHEEHILRCYVYFSSLPSVNMASVQEEHINIDGWHRDGQMLGDEGKMCIIYEKAVDS